MQDSTIWVGLDVHKESITAAVLVGDDDGTEVIKMPSDLNKVRRLFRRLARRGPVRTCYEASGAGFVLHRCLEQHGFSCDVVAPSLIPRKPGDRRKTDRLDAVQLARLYRSGHLTPVAVPTEDQEAIRTLVRLRLPYKRQVTSTKHRICGMLHYRGLHFAGTKSNWTKKHRVWLEGLRGELDGPLGCALRMQMEHLEYLESQLNALDMEIERYSQRAPYRETVEALQCLRGVKVLTAMALAAEIGDIHRFRSPRALMAWVGLVPGERSSGDRQKRGPITKSGNSHLRRVLIEAAWNNRHRAGADLILRRRRQGQPPGVVAIAVKAQHRLSKRFHRLWGRKHPNVAITAVARELCGFVWAIMNAAPQQS
jgi:transposase